MQTAENIHSQPTVGVHSDRGDHQGVSTMVWLDDVTVSFNGFKALDRLDLRIEPGELRCVIGPNGAGKTTMMDVISGKTRPHSGKVYLSREAIDLAGYREDQIAMLGIGRKFQRPTVFEDLTVLENLELACRGRKGVWHSLFAGMSGEQRDKVTAIVERINLSSQRHDSCRQLSHGQKQWLEIGMLLAQEPNVLLVDEPIAGMTHGEAARTAELLDSLAGAHTVIVVEHDMDFVHSIARKVTVLHQGRVLAEGRMDEVQSDPKVIEVYLGTAPEPSSSASDQRPISRWYQNGDLDSMTA
ncbi:MAG: urea ABC transporter ATP-binding protein UrtD [Proteobacteria bacterium]|nr:urea ABC transporter ATP-binding protein UrtD [Pseudomonadota bacterium]